MKNPDRTYSDAELVEMVRGMKRASAEFYVAATRIGHHPFIEWTGLLNEYIKLCEDALANGIDFTRTSVHSGQALPMQSYHVVYLAEKLQCIFGTALEDPRLAEAFVRGIIGARKIQKACNKCSQGAMDLANPHRWGLCTCSCHADPDAQQALKLNEERS